MEMVFFYVTLVLLFFGVVILISSPLKDVYFEKMYDVDEDTDDDELCKLQKKFRICDDILCIGWIGAIITSVVIFICLIINLFIVIF